jgi:cytochrome c2
MEMQMRKLSAILFTVAFGVTLAAGAQALAAQGGSAEKGKQLYTTQKCAMCHSIGDAGNKKGPLDGVGTKLKAEEIRQWMLSPNVMAEKTKSTRKPAMASYTKLPKDDLESIIAYMQTLKKS